MTETTRLLQVPTLQTLQTLQRKLRSGQGSSCFWKATANSSLPQGSYLGVFAIPKSTFFIIGCGVKRTASKQTANFCQITNSQADYNSGSNSSITKRTTVWLPGMYASGPANLCSEPVVLLLRNFPSAQNPHGP